MVGRARDSRSQLSPPTSKQLGLRPFGAGKPENRVPSPSLLGKRLAARAASYGGRGRACHREGTGREVWTFPPGSRALHPQAAREKAREGLRCRSLALTEQTGPEPSGRSHRWGQPRGYVTPWPRVGTESPSGSGHKHNRAPWAPCCSAPLSAALSGVCVRGAVSSGMDVAPFKNVQVATQHWTGKEVETAL